MRSIFTFLLCALCFAGFGQNPIVINELMARNTSTEADQDGEFDDWIELHNISNSPVDISGYHISDNPMNLDKFPFPDGTVIEALGYLIVWADEDGPQDGLHANFKLSGSGEELFLSTQDTMEIINHVAWGEQTEDISFARLPNGTGDFQAATPTFNGSNGGTATNEVDFQSQLLTVSPNPASTHLTIQLDDTDSNELHIRIFNSVGQLIEQRQETGHLAEIPVDALPAGLYFVIVNERFGQQIVISQ